MIDRWIDRKHRKIKRSPVKLWDITILAPYSVCREALTNSALTRQHTFYNTLAQTQSMKLHCPFLPVNSNKKHLFHKGVGGEMFRVYPDLDSGSSRHPYGHACVCVHTHACTCAPKGSPWLHNREIPWETAISTCQINTFSQVIKVGRLVNLFSARACWQSARSHSRDRLFQLGRRPAFLGEAAFADPPEYARTPAIASPMRASNSQSVCCTRCLGECFLFKTVFTSHRNLRGKVLSQRTFYSQRLQHWEKLGSMSEATQLDIGGAGQQARPVWCRSWTLGSRPDLTEQGGGSGVRSVGSRSPISLF